MKAVIRTRLLAVLTAVAAGGAAFFAREKLSGFNAKFLGDALWATGIYFLVVFVRPGLPIGRAALCAVLGCWLVELAQLTPVPAWISSHHPILRVIFGTTFHFWDLAAYPLGVFLGAVVHRCFR